MRRPIAARAMFLALAVAPPSAIDWQEVQAARRPHEAELVAEARLAEVARVLARSAGPLREGAVIEVLAGSRRSAGEGSDPDGSLALEVPLVFARPEQRELAARLREAAPLLRAAARASADLELRLAYLDAWRAGAEMALRRQDLEAVESWLAAARRRVEAGADAPYQAVLVDAERVRAALALVEARRAETAAWGVLRARAGIGPEPRTALGPPEPEEPLLSGDVDALFLAGARRRAPLVAAALDSARSALETRAATSRWGVGGDVEREGDEEAAHVGLTYRIAPRGEREAAEAAHATVVAAAEQAAVQEVEAVDASFRAARELEIGFASGLDEEEVARAAGALGLRLEEGKDRPSEVLPLRRQLIEARLAILAARHARAAARAELESLIQPAHPVDPVGGDSP